MIHEYVVLTENGLMVLLARDDTELTEVRRFLGSTIIEHEVRA